MKFFNALVNSRAMHNFITDVKNGNIGHAYMLITPDKDVVEEFFTIMACAVYCPNGICLKCDECKKISDGNNANVKFIRNDAKQSIGVETVKELTEDSVIRPYEKGRKFYFIPNAENMTIQAQNKLLKTIEEPSEYVTIVLGASSEGMMLNTVISRVKKLYLDYFDAETIASALHELYPTADTEFAVGFANGQLGRANMIANDLDFKTLYDNAFDMLISLKKSADVAKFVRNPYFARDKIGEMLDVIELIMRDIIALDAGCPELAASLTKMKELDTIRETFSIASATAVNDVIGETRERLRVNCDSETLAERLLFKILEVKYLCR